MLEREPRENNQSDLDVVYKTLDTQGKAAIDAARNLVVEFLEKDDIKGLKEALDNSDEWKKSFSDKNTRKEVAKLLSAEIKRQFKEKREAVVVTPEKYAKPGSVRAIFEASQAKGEELKRMLAQDAQDIQDAHRQIEELLPEEQEARKRLLAEIDKRGRLVVTTDTPRELATKRKFDPHRFSGFQTIVDQKSVDSPYANTPYDRAWKDLQRDISTLSLNLSASSIDHMMKEAEINTLITIGPLEKSVPVYEEVEKTSWLVFKKKQIEQTGIKREKVGIDQLNGDENDKEQAYVIKYRVIGTDKNPYHTTDMNRHGNIFDANIILPKSVALEAFAKIQESPEFAKEILKTLDPELMKTQLDVQDERKRDILKNYGKKGYMPQGDKVLIIPEGAKEAFEREEGRPSIGKKVNPVYIKSISNRV